MAEAGTAGKPLVDAGTQVGTPVATMGFGARESADETRQAQQSVSNDAPTDVNFNAIFAPSPSLTLCLLFHNGSLDNFLFFRSCRGFRLHGNRKFIVRRKALAKPCRLSFAAPQEIEFGTADGFTTTARKKIVMKEPTVMCAGIGTNLTGLHFDYAKIDDIVNRETVTNDTQLQASKDYFALLRYLFDNPSIRREDVAGTIYHFNDLHSELRNNPLYVKSIVPVYDEQGHFNFPERIDKERFLELQNDPSTSPYDVASQYLLKPFNPKDAVFKPEWWQEYDALPEGLKEYIVVDPASTQKKKTDFTLY